MADERDVILALKFPEEADSRYAATVQTADTDFQRFPDVRWHNPIARKQAASRAASCGV